MLYSPGSDQWPGRPVILVAEIFAARHQSVSQGPLGMGAGILAVQTNRESLLEDAMEKRKDGALPAEEPAKPETA